MPLTSEAVALARRNQTLAVAGVAAAIVTAYLTWRMLRGSSAPTQTAGQPATDPAVLAGQQSVDPTGLSALAAETGIPGVDSTTTGGYGLTDPATFAGEIATALQGLGVTSAPAPAPVILPPVPAQPPSATGPDYCNGVHRPPNLGAANMSWVCTPSGWQAQSSIAGKNPPAAKPPAPRPAGQSTGAVRPTTIASVPNLGRGTKPHVTTPVGHVHPSKVAPIHHPAPKPKAPPRRAAPTHRPFVPLAHR